MNMGIYKPEKTPYLDFFLMVPVVCFYQILTLAVIFSISKMIPEIQLVIFLFFTL